LFCKTPPLAGGVFVWLSGSVLTEPNLACSVADAELPAKILKIKI
jgi:hypothetical protein